MWISSLLQVWSYEGTRRCYNSKLVTKVATRYCVKPYDLMHESRSTSSFESSNAIIVHIYLYKTQTSYSRGSQNEGHGPKVARGGVESGPPSPYKKNHVQFVFFVETL